MPRITVNVLLILAAVVFAVIFTVQGFGWWEVEHPFGWLGLSVACGWASFIAWGSRPAA